LSEPYPSEAAPPEEESVPSAVDAAEADEPVERRSRSGWIAPAWFFFGIIVGIVGFAAYNALIVKPATTAQVESLAATANMRAAARDGVLEAIATLQAGGGQPAAQQEPQGPQVVANNTFTVRDTNRQGDANATVTVFEFSDFQ
jgi:hypothetical protein